MSDQFEDLVVVRFTTTEADQDPVHKAIFRFQFLLSRPAPGLWIDIAKQEVGENSWVNFSIRRKAWAYGDRIVVACSADEAQSIKDKLNAEVLPFVNGEYRRLAGAAQARREQEQRQQRAIMGKVERRIRDQA